jgi:hypothetical protein
MSWVTILAYVQTAIQAYESCLAYFKQWIRTCVGPAPVELLVFSDNRILPGTTTYCSDQTPLTYSDENHTLRSGEECRKRLPWVSIVYTRGELIHDFSDWCSMIRCSHPPPLLALVRLAAAAHNVYLSEDSAAEVRAMNRMGEEEVFVFQGSAALIKKPIIIHRPTMPYDGVDGLFF